MMIRVVIQGLLWALKSEFGHSHITFASSLPHGPSAHRYKTENFTKTNSVFLIPTSSLVSGLTSVGGLYLSHCVPNLVLEQKSRSSDFVSMEDAGPSVQNIYFICFHNSNSLSELANAIL